MKRITRREFLIEQETLEVLIKNKKRKYPSCELCREKRIMITPLMIAEILQISSREIYKRIETGKIHFIEDDSFQLFVCPNSLAKSFYRKEKLLH